MSRFFPLLFAVLALISSHVAFGAPSGSHGNMQVDNCISKCRNQFGWLLASSSSPSPTPTPTALQEPSPSPSPTTSSTNNPATTPSSSDNVSSDDITAYLSAHNTERSQHGANPLTWSDSLSAKAQQWANGCVFKHSGGSLGPFGENLAAGTGSFTISDAIGLWNAEVSQYNPNNPVPSHWTQVVWKSTTQVGCAVQSCSGIFPANEGLAKYYVCEYSPAGNIIGDFAQNVQD